MLLCKIDQKGKTHCQMVRRRTSKHGKVSHLKKYRNRPSPPKSAQAHRGQIMTGNDGRKWKSAMASNGVCRWTVLGAKKRGRKGRKASKGRKKAH